jgi:hypothetical protein
MWGLTNKLALGKNFNDPSLLEGHPDMDNGGMGNWSYGSNSIAPEPVSDQHHSEYADRLHELAENVSHSFKHAIDEYTKDVKLGSRFKQACEKVAYAAGPPGWDSGGDTFGMTPVSQSPTPLDVNINALGQTLYNQGASPNLAATTMSAMYAAQQLPDHRAAPGWATYGQLGQLAQNAASDYGKGMLAGGLINAAIGTPFAASSFGLGNVALGVIGAVVPKFFGGS